MTVSETSISSVSHSLMPTGFRQLLRMRAHFEEIKNAVSPFVLVLVDLNAAVHVKIEFSLVSLSYISLRRNLLIVPEI
jgi:hypothetical protein